MTPEDFPKAYKTAVRTTRDAVIKPRPQYIPRSLWRWFARQVIDFDQIPLGTITEVTLNNGSVQAHIVLAGQKEAIDAQKTPKH